MIRELILPYLDRQIAAAVCLAAGGIELPTGSWRRSDLGGSPGRARLASVI